MTEELTKKTLRDLAQMWFRRRWTFGLCAAVFAIVALVAAHFLPVQYTASARFQRQVVQTADKWNAEASSKDQFETVKMTLYTQLIGETAVTKAADKLGYFNDIKPRLAAGKEDALRIQSDRVAELRRRLGVRWDVQSTTVDLVTLTFTSSNRRQAMALPNMLVALYAEDVPGDVARRLGATREFLADQVARCDKLVKEINDRKINMEGSNVGLMETPHAEVLYRQQLVSADEEAVRRLLNIAQQRYGRLQKIKEERDKNLTTEPQQVIKGPNPELERLGAELQQYKIELDLAMTLQHMTERHPAIQTLLARIRIMEERIRNTPEEIVIQALYGTGAGGDILANQISTAQAEVEFLESELDRVRSQREGYEKLNSSLQGVRKEYATLLEDLASVQEEAKDWKERLRKIDMALASEVAGQRVDLETVEKAKLPEATSFPRSSYVLPIAFGGALVFAAMVVVLLNRKDRTISTVEEAAVYFDVPVRGLIGEIVTRRRRYILGFQRWVVTPLVTLVLLAIIAVVTAGLVLKLEYPGEYEQWRKKSSSMMPPPVAAVLFQSHDKTW